MRRTYRYCKQTGKMVEVTKEKKRSTLHVIPDIEPYQAIGPEYGKLITSRSKHREYLKKHNLTEVGNERKYFGLGDKQPH